VPLHSEKTKSILENQQLHLIIEETPSDTYQLNFLAAKPDPGFYTLTFSISPLEKKNFIGSQAVNRKIKVLTEVTVSNFEIRVADYASDAVSKRIPLNFGQKLSQNISYDHLQKIGIAFTFKHQGQTNPKVQQAFIKFTHAKTQTEVFFVMKPTQTQYVLDLSIQEHYDTFHYQSGDYDVDLIVGDTFLQHPIRWSIGRVTISLPAAPSSYTQPKSQTLYDPLPVIEHAFRKPEKRPPLVISLAFTGLVLSPFLVLFIGLVWVGANMKKLASLGVNFLSAVLFEASIISILCLFALYWLRLNMFQTLFYLGGLSLPTIFFGQKTLRALSESKQKQE